MIMLKIGMGITFKGSLTMVYILYISANPTFLGMKAVHYTGASTPRPTACPQLLVVRPQPNLFISK